MVWVASLVCCFHDLEIDGGAETHVEEEAEGVGVVAAVKEDFREICDSKMDFKVAIPSLFAISETHTVDLDDEDTVQRCYERMHVSFRPDLGQISAFKINIQSRDLGQCHGDDHVDDGFELCAGANKGAIVWWAKKSRGFDDRGTGVAWRSVACDFFITGAERRLGGSGLSTCGRRFGQRAASPYSASASPSIPPEFFRRELVGRAVGSDPRGIQKQSLSAIVPAVDGLKNLRLPAQKHLNLSNLSADVLQT